MSTVIKVENLSKEYRLGTIGHNYLFRDLQSAWARLRGKEDPNQKMGAGQVAKGKYRALDDVSFEVKQGEVLGIIGRNGAGKSTLLKILSRVTTPTQGSIKVRGRIASLLEVGTGFHPELTGRENIFLNGAILGMSKNEVKAKFDEIVDFAGIGEFIDTPVKRYSSGMYVRLAFAVAAHLEPEILIIDEVLAVGDAEFQKKCLGKMKDVAGQGRTVLFVSHNMAAVQNLCTRALLINNGKLALHGSTDRIITEYITAIRTRANELDLASRKDRQGNGQARFLSYSIVDQLGKKITSTQSGAEVSLAFEIEILQPNTSLSVSIGLDDPMGQRILLLNNEIVSGAFLNLSQGVYNVAFRVSRLPLKSGQYTFTVFAASAGIILDWIQTAGILVVESGDYYGTGKMPPELQGYFLLDYNASIMRTTIKAEAIREI